MSDTPRTPTASELRQWASSPDAQSRMVPVHPGTLRTIANLLAARDAEVARLRNYLRSRIRNIYRPGSGQYMQWIIDETTIAWTKGENSSMDYVIDHIHEDDLSRYPLGEVADE